MIVYHYDPKTYELLNTSVAKIDPLESAKQGKEVYLLPANATSEEPPTAAQNQVARRSGMTWELVADYRGSIYYNKDNGAKITITELGVTIPDGYPTQAPPMGMFSPQWDGTSWIESAIVYQGQTVASKAEVDEITRLRIACLGEEKAKTEKLVAGSNTCTIWDEFIAARAIILQEGDDFIIANNLS